MNTPYHFLTRTIITIPYRVFDEVKNDAPLPKILKEYKILYTRTLVTRRINKYCLGGFLSKLFPIFNCRYIHLEVCIYVGKTGKNVKTPIESRSLAKGRGVGGS